MFILSRSQTSKRPLCQHEVSQLLPSGAMTTCGLYLTGSAQYVPTPFDAILCMRCKLANR